MNPLPALGPCWTPWCVDTAFKPRLANNCRYFVICPNCGCRTPSELLPEDAIKTWNERSSQVGPVPVYDPQTSINMTFEAFAKAMRAAEEKGAKQYVDKIAKACGYDSFLDLLHAAIDGNRCVPLELTEKVEDSV